MPAHMRIMGWKSEGLRCPDHEINLMNTDSIPYQISLIQMPNGTGKTTTLNLLRAALSGAAMTKWEREEIKELQKRGSSNDYGYFELRLMLNDRLVTVIMNFDFENGAISYKTTRGDGQVDGFDPPFEFRRFMSENFVNFNIFDGELAEHLLNRDYTDAELVVEHLFQINTLEILQNKISEYWRDKTQNVTATEERGLSRRRNRLRKLEERRKELNEEKEIIGNRYNAIKENLTKQREKYKLEIDKEEERSKNINQANEKKLQLSNEVNFKSRQLLEFMTAPHSLSSKFANAIFELKTGLDRVKLPESAAREFFEELSDEDECICGRPIDNVIKEVILTKSSQYLGSDDVSLLNSMKTSIDEAVGRSRDEAEFEVLKQIKVLEETVRDERLARNEFDELESMAEQSDPAIKSAKNNIEDLERQLKQCEQELHKFQSNDKDSSDEKVCDLNVIDKRIKEAEDQLAEITQTIELRDKRDILTEIFSNAHKKAKLGITKEICKDANNKITELMPNNNIKIEKIDHCLHLEGQSGGSVGEQLSVAYAFLSTLFNRSEHILPFVVDSPAGPIDLQVRPKIGGLVPKLSKQFIAFTISTEREGFLPNLKKTSGSPIQYITVFRKGSAELENLVKSYQSSSFLETKDGFCVIDEKFFNEFQLESE